MVKLITIIQTQQCFLPGLARFTSKGLGGSRRGQWEKRGNVQRLGDEDLGCRINTVCFLVVHVFRIVSRERKGWESNICCVYIFNIHMNLCWSNDEVVLSSAIVYLQVVYVHYPRCIRHDLVIFPKKTILISRTLGIHILNMHWCKDGRLLHLFMDNHSCFSRSHNHLPIWWLKWVPVFCLPPTLGFILFGVVL